MKDVSEVVYASDSGALLPERQWHERIVITRGRVTLTRNGRTADTLVNAGAWELAVAERAVAALFGQLAVVDCAKIKRVEAADAPDGGGVESYAVAYASGKTCALLYDPGTTYTRRRGDRGADCGVHPGVGAPGRGGQPLSLIRVWVMHPFIDQDCPEIVHASDPNRDC